MEPIRYVDALNNKYGAMGFPPYQWSENDSAPWTALEKPLAPAPGLRRGRRVLLFPKNGRLIPNPLLLLGSSSPLPSSILTLLPPSYPLKNQHWAHHRDPEKGTGDLAGDSPQHTTFHELT